MTAIMFREILIITVFSIVTKKSDAVPYLYEIQGDLTWTSAVKSCISNYNGRLANRTELEEYVKLNRSIYNYGNLQNAKGVWVREHEYKSSWIAAEGCYINIAGDREETFTDNSVGKCYKYCDGYTYFATKKTSCKCCRTNCLSGSEGDIGTICNITCPGNENEKCGGENVYDLYRKLDIHPVQDTDCGNSQHCDCVGVRCNQSRLSLVNLDCTMPYPSVCVDLRSRPFISKSLMWSNIFFECESSTGKYPYKNLDNQNFSNILCNPKTDAWIGIFRLSLTSDVYFPASLQSVPTCTFCMINEENKGRLSCTSSTQCQSDILRKPSVCLYDPITNGVVVDNTLICVFASVLGFLFGVILTSIICMTVVRKAWGKKIKLRHAGSSETTTRQNAQEHVYFAASGDRHVNNLYEDLIEPDYVEPIS